MGRRRAEAVALLYLGEPVVVRVSLWSVSAPRHSRH